MDEYTGAIKQKNPEPPNGSARDAVSLSRKAAQGKKRPTTLNFRNRNILKPQLRFTTKVDNFDSAVFKPLLTTKPHAIVPLEQSLGTFYDDHLRPQHYHPYKTEIEKLQYPSEVYEIHPPINYHPFESTTGIMVDTAESLHAMLDELKRAKEIAVDLEHHSDRSFIGFVCLMQISTREKDWIIDTLKLRGELMVLNEVFADPRIVKVRSPDIPHKFYTKY